MHKRGLFVYIHYKGVPLNKTLSSFVPIIECSVRNAI